MISILSVINDIPQDSLSHRNTVVKKVESKDVNVLFIIPHILLLHTTRPGSRVKNNAVKCSICDKTFGTSRKREVSQRLSHVSCLNISKMQQQKLDSKNCPPAYLQCVYIK